MHTGIRIVLVLSFRHTYSSYKYGRLRREKSRKIVIATTNDEFSVLSAPKMRERRENEPAKEREREKRPAEFQQCPLYTL